LDLIPFSKKFFVIGSLDGIDDLNVSPKSNGNETLGSDEDTSSIPERRTTATAINNKRVIVVIDSEDDG